MAIQRVGQQLIKNGFVLTKTREGIPAFQLKKSTIQHLTTADGTGGIIDLTASGGTTHGFLFHDGDMIQGNQWIVGDQIETTQTITCNLDDFSMKFPAGTSVSADTGVTAVDAKTGVGTSGTDFDMIGSYAIYFKYNSTNNTGSLVYSKDFSLEFTPTRNQDISNLNTVSTLSNQYRLIGGFEFSPFVPAYAAGTGGAQATTINHWSIWDQEYRPKCDPRGMTCVGGNYWVDIYFTSKDIALGQSTSRFNTPYWTDGAEVGNTASIMHPILGYDILTEGTSVNNQIYPGDCYEVAMAFGKTMMSYEHFIGAATGVIEQESGDTWFTAAKRPDSTADYNNYHNIHVLPNDNGYKSVSQCGVIGATGLLWTWGQFQSGAYSTEYANHDGRNRGTQWYNGQGALVLGGAWADGSNCGSRTLNLANGLSASYWAQGCRFLGFF